MMPEDPIIERLNSQKISHEVVQSNFDPDPDSKLSTVVRKWKNKFIKDKSVPSLDVYLWHIFSFGSTKSQEGILATKEYLSQYPAKIFIFNEHQQYLIECESSIPKITMNDFTDDIYICHHNMKWTYVITHEDPEFGPYFSMG